MMKKYFIELPRPPSLKVHYIMFLHLFNYVLEKLIQYYYNMNLIGASYTPTKRMNA